MERVLLVGESNPHSDSDSHALLPWPPNAAGDRLCNILGFSKRDYLKTFDRANLMAAGEGWDLLVARARARQLTHARRILLGTRVCAAHGVPFKPFFRNRDRSLDLLVLPHPSGLCRMWNDKRSVGRARRAVRRFLR